MSHFEQTHAIKLVTEWNNVTPPYSLFWKASWNVFYTYFRGAHDESFRKKIVSKFRGFSKSLPKSLRMDAQAGAVLNELDKFINYLQLVMEVFYEVCFYPDSEGLILLRWIEWICYRMKNKWVLYSFQKIKLVTISDLFEFKV